MRKLMSFDVPTTFVGIFAYEDHSNKINYGGMGWQK